MNVTLIILFKRYFKNEITHFEREITYFMGDFTH